MRGKLFTIMRYEWRMLKAGKLAQISIALLMVMIMASLITNFLSYSDHYAKVQENTLEQKQLYHRIHEEISEVEEEHPGNWKTPGFLQSGSLAPATIFDKSVNFRATIPYSPLSILNSRQLSWFPQTFAYKPAGARYTPFYRTYGTQSIGGTFPERSTENPLLMLIGRLDLAFITLNILPLLLLALTYNLISTEKESGTLALMLSNPVSLKTIIIGKLAVRFLLFITVCVVIPLILVLGLTVWHNPQDITRELFAAFFFWFIAAATYILFWLALSLFINFLNKSASFHALLSVIMWLALVVLIPAICDQIIKVTTPINQHYRFVTEERKASLAINAKIDAAKSALNTAFNVTHVKIPNDKISKQRYDTAYFYQPFQLITGTELADSFIRSNPAWKYANTPNQLMRMLSETRVFMIENRLGPVLKEMEMTEAHQENLSFLLSFLSPSMLLKSIFDDIAEVGSKKNKSFLKQLDTYIRNRENTFNKTTLALANVSSKNYEESKVFIYKKNATLVKIKNLILRIGGILSLTMVLLLWSFARIKSYRLTN